MANNIYIYVYICIIIILTIVIIIINNIYIYIYRNRYIHNSRATGFANPTGKALGWLLVKGAPNFSERSENSKP